MNKCFSQIKDIRCETIEEIEQKNYNPKDMYTFEGKYVDNTSWFDLDSKWVKTNYNTRGQDFYKRLLQTYVKVKSET